MFAIAWAAFALLMLSLDRLHRGTSRILTNSMIFLMSIGIVMLWRLRPDNCIRQIWWIVISAAVMNLMMFILRGRWVYRIPWWVFAAAAFGLIALPFIFPSPENGALNWADIHGFSFQPSELVKPVLVFLLSALYMRRRRVSSVLVGAVVTGGLSVALLIQNDLGMILIFCTMYLLMTYDYTQREWILAVGVLAVIVAGFGAYKLVGHVRTRVDIWLDPWKDIDGGGYQIAQSLFAISAGRFFGKGLFQGMPYYIPEGWTDMIFAAICEEFGGIFGFMTVMIYLLMALLMFDLVSRYESRLRRNLAMACSIITGVQTCLIMGGVIKLLPLTGVTLPLVSYGGTSLLSTCIIMAIVQELFRSRSQTERKVRKNEERKQREAERARKERFQDTIPYQLRRKGTNESGGQVSKRSSERTGAFPFKGPED